MPAAITIFIATIIFQPTSQRPLRTGRPHGRRRRVGGCRFSPGWASLEESVPRQSRMLGTSDLACFPWTQLAGARRGRGHVQSVRTDFECYCLTDFRTYRLGRMGKQTQRCMGNKKLWRCSINAGYMVDSSEPADVCRTCQPGGCHFPTDSLSGTQGFNSSYMTTCE